MKYFMMGFVFFLSVGCQSTPKNGLPIPNFQYVEPGVFRGGQPETEEAFALLKSLGVKVILKLNTENSDSESIMAANYGMTVIDEPMSGFWAPTEDQMSRTQVGFEHVDKAPIFVHCEHGQDRTGLVLGVHRVHEGWTKQRAYDEMRLYGFHPILLGLKHYWDTH